MAVAQTATEPALHHRDTTSTQAPAQPTGLKQRGTSTLPADASGEYLIDEEGSVVQITIEAGRLNGYVSKLVDDQSSLTFYFDRTTINGNHLTFTTRQIHGIWYSFDGTILRGDAKTKQENGFYRLSGSWMLHDQAHKAQSTSSVSLKSTPRDD